MGPQQCLPPEPPSCRMHILQAGLWQDPERERDQHLPVTDVGVQSSEIVFLHQIICYCIHSQWPSIGLASCDPHNQGKDPQGRQLHISCVLKPPAPASLTALFFSYLSHLPSLNVTKAEKPGAYLLLTVPLRYTGGNGPYTPWTC